VLLAASIFALLIGPLLFQMARAGPRAFAFLEGFTFITIAGLLCFSILPQAIVVGGPPAWSFAIVGLLFPIVLERLFHRLAREVHLLILTVGVAGLAVHAALDGVALALNAQPGLAPASAWLHGGGEERIVGSLALAVVLHRFPVGLAVWYLLAPALGMRSAIAVLALLAAGTGLGFLIAPDIQQSLPSHGLGWFQAFVAGSILHVIIYEPGHHKPHPGRRPSRLYKWPDRMGLICGLVLLYIYL
jgi:zinc transporter ZupT